MLFRSGVTLHGGARTIELMRWGLVPHWAGHDGKKPPLMINARVESLPAKQFFRDALQRKRCLVPADGFFEWVKAAHEARASGKKPPPRPFYFHPRSGHLAAFAGLWARSHDDRGTELHSFTIITAKANDVVRPIHDRMPIVLAPSDYAAWLDPAVDGDAARASWAALTHSKNPSAGTRQRLRSSASRKNCLAWSDSTRALIMSGGFLPARSAQNGTSPQRISSIVRAPPCSVTTGAGWVGATFQRGFHHGSCDAATSSVASRSSTIFSCRVSV